MMDLLQMQNKKIEKQKKKVYKSLKTLCISIQTEQLNTGTMILV